MRKGKTREGKKRREEARTESERREEEKRREGKMGKKGRGEKGKGKRRRGEKEKGEKGKGEKGEGRKGWRSLLRKKGINSPPLLYFNLSIAFSLSCSYTYIVPTIYCQEAERPATETHKEPIKNISVRRSGAELLQKSYFCQNLCFLFFYLVKAFSHSH